MHDQEDRSFRLLSYHDDQPREQQGALIPRTGKTAEPVDLHPVTISRSFDASPLVGVGFGAVALFLLALVGTAGYGLMEQNSLVATPLVTVIDPYTNERSTLSYGPQVALTTTNFFVETRDAFIDESVTFIEVDVASEQLRYFKNGVLLQSTKIESVGEPGSWWAVPAGLYQIEKLESRPYSNLAQVYLPHTVRFGGNYIIHGQPEYPDGQVVSDEEQVGGIRISNEAAERLFSVVAPDTTVLVHLPPAERDTFVYEPTAPEVGAPQYLIADVENGTILAASDLEDVAPIASVTKLMTAVVAAEQIDLDTRVRVTAPSFVESLIPRLADRSSVSIYSLLQLLLVESSNEAAEVIAGQIGREAFVAAMNEKAQNIGMANSQFVDPSGLLAGNTSSVGDLYTLVRYIHENRSFIFEITDTNRVANDYVGGEFDGLVNFNKIEDIDSFIGGKIGETTAAGQTSVSLHEVQIQGEERIVMVVLLGSEDRVTDAQSLLRYVENNFSQN